MPHFFREHIVDNNGKIDIEQLKEIANVNRGTYEKSSGVSQAFERRGQRRDNLKGEGAATPVQTKVKAVEEGVK